MRKIGLEDRGSEECGEDGGGGEGRDEGVGGWKRGDPARLRKAWRLAL